MHLICTSDGRLGLTPPYPNGDWNTHFTGIAVIHSSTFSYNTQLFLLIGGFNQHLPIEIDRIRVT